jgi:hypothetical protein
MCFVKNARLAGIVNEKYIAAKRIEDRDKRDN